AGPVAREDGARARARFASPPADLAARLSQIPAVEAALVEVRGAEALLDVGDGEAGAAALVRALVEAGLAVAAFVPERASLESAYLAEAATRAGKDRS
ncbi:MAG: hypothetical protein MI723_14925, partial [Caulobacterales bacterium]|nr:hypothetical protein [Caulobacterales bacterium]